MATDYEAFGQYLPRSREKAPEFNMVDPYRVARFDAVQVHPIPEKITYAYGPFAPEVMKEPDVILVPPAINEDGSEFPLGSTVQNNFKPVSYLFCGECYAKVLASETESHVCGG